MATPTAEEGEAFTSMLRHIGLTSPVTKAVAGALYNQELARQLSEFVRWSSIALSHSCAKLIVCSLETGHIWSGVAA